MVGAPAGQGGAAGDIGIRRDGCNNATEVSRGVGWKNKASDESIFFQTKGRPVGNWASVSRFCLLLLHSIVCLMLTLTV